MPDLDVAIIGAGPAGLTCARILHQRGVSCAVLEASDAPGGRVRTDNHQGFLLDRGFQVLLTAYPEAQRTLNYESLQLKAFTPGALVRVDGRFHRVIDPFRKPVEALGTLFSPIGKLTDKLKVAQMRSRVLAGTLDELMAREETGTVEALRAEGFSDTMIDRFFRPFLGGVFFDRDLRTSSRMMDFVFRMFSSGDTAVPARGMGEITAQLAAGLDVRLNSAVDSIEPGTVRLANGSSLTARCVVVATEGPEAAKLLNGTEAAPWRSVSCLYFDAPEDPVGDAMLVLNGETGAINNLVAMSRVSAEYAPKGRTLISVTVLEEPADLLASVCGQLEDWYGRQVRTWRHLRTYRIPHALPRRYPGDLPAKVTAPGGIYVCGDHLTTASLNGAMESGRVTAEAILRD